MCARGCQAAAVRAHREQPAELQRQRGVASELEAELARAGDVQARVLGDLASEAAAAAQLRQRLSVAEAICREMPAPTPVDDGSEARASKLEGEVKSLEEDRRGGPEHLTLRPCALLCGAVGSATDLREHADTRKGGGARVAMVSAGVDAIIGSARAIDYVRTCACACAHVRMCLRACLGV